MFHPEHTCLTHFYSRLHCMHVYNVHVQYNTHSNPPSYPVIILNPKQERGSLYVRLFIYTYAVCQSDKHIETGITVNCWVYNIRWPCTMRQCTSSSVMLSFLLRTIFFFCQFSSFHFNFTETYITTYLVLAGLVASFVSSQSALPQYYYVNNNQFTWYAGRILTSNIRYARCTAPHSYQI